MTEKTPLVLYTMPASLYSAKARSYLRSQGIPHVERAPGSPRYTNEIVPAIGRWIIPVLELPDGTLVQDTVDIIDLLEGEVDPSRSAYPADPVLLVVAHVLELFGGEGLLRPAMHYRWDFDDVNLPFLSEDFAGVLVPGGDREARQAVFAAASGRMRKATAAFGVNAETAPAVERSYEAFLDLLQAHFEDHPYLLGGRPTLPDYAFMGPLYAHLARDPAPSVLMKQRAPRVWRWTERMNNANSDVPEYGDRSPDLVDPAALPATLRALLAYVGEEHAGELAAQVAAVDAWLAEHPDVAEGDVVGGRPDKRFLGTTTFPWRAHELTVSVVPYRIFMLQRVQDAFARAGDAREAVRAVLEGAGLGGLLDLRPRRRVERRDNREVWGEAQEPATGG